MTTFVGAALAANSQLIVQNIYSRLKPLPHEAPTGDQHEKARISGLFHVSKKSGRQDAGKNGFEVFGFRDGRMNRVIAALMAVMHDLCRAINVT